MYEREAYLGRIGWERPAVDAGNGASSLLHLLDLLIA